MRLAASQHVERRPIEHVDRLSHVRSVSAPKMAEICLKWVYPGWVLV